MTPGRGLGLLASFQGAPPLSFPDQSLSLATCLRPGECRKRTSGRQALARALVDATLLSVWELPGASEERGGEQGSGPWRAKGQG